MITNEHIEQFLSQAHRYGAAKLMYAVAAISLGELVKKH